MKKVALGILAFLVILSEFASAQSNSILEGYYDTEFFLLGYSKINGLTVSYQNQTYHTQFVLPRNLRDIIATYEDTEKLVNSYVKQNIAGNILLFTGLAVLLTSGVMLAAAADATDEDQYNFSLVIGSGGLLVSMPGLILFNSSLQKLSSAINSYNRHKISEFQSE